MQFFFKPATQEITVEVEYAPEVTAEEIFVHAAEGKMVVIKNYTVLVYAMYSVREIYINLTRKVLHF